MHRIIAITGHRGGGRANEGLQGVRRGEAVDLLCQAWPQQAWLAARLHPHLKLDAAAYRDLGYICWEGISRAAQRPAMSE